MVVTSQKLDSASRLANDEHLAELAQGYSGVADFLEEGIRLAEMIYPGRINGFSFKDVGDRFALDEGKDTIEERDNLEGCEICFLTERCPLEDYLPLDLKGSFSGKRAGEPDDDGNPLRLTKAPRTY